MSYIKMTTYLFEAGEVDWAITGFGPEYVEFEETRKNGQEDTHVSGVIELLDGKWTVTEGREDVSNYFWDDTVHQLEKFVQTNGLPTE